MVNIRYLEREPISKTSERGSSYAIHTMLDRLSFMMKRETQYTLPVTTFENILEPLGSNSAGHDLHIVTLCCFCRSRSWWGTHLALSLHFDAQWNMHFHNSSLTTKITI